MNLSVRRNTKYFNLNSMKCFRWLRRTPKRPVQKKICPSKNYPNHPTIYPAIPLSKTMSNNRFSLLPRIVATKNINLLDKIIFSKKKIERQWNNHLYENFETENTHINLINCSKFYTFIICFILQQSFPIFTKPFLFIISLINWN